MYSCQFVLRVAHAVMTSKSDQSMSLLNDIWHITCHAYHWRHVLRAACCTENSV